MSGEASKLDKRVMLQKRQDGQDSVGQPLETWEAVTTIGASGIFWADIKAVSGREYFAAQANQSQVQTKIITRFFDGVLPSMRIVHGSTIYNIEAVLPQGRRWLWLMCSSGVNNG
jgi:SPP1 family predicted phage head-tail adaptor